MSDLVSWEIASKAMPLEASNIDKTTGKKRSRARRNLRERVTLAVMAKAGNRCLNCASFEETDNLGRANVCQMHSDFQGVSTTYPDGLCLDFHGGKP